VGEKTGGPRQSQLGRNKGGGERGQTVRRGLRDPVVVFWGCRKKVGRDWVKTVAHWRRRKKKPTTERKLTGREKGTERFHRILMLDG